MINFTDEHKTELNVEYFEVGVHEVKITAVIGGKTDKNAEYIEFMVANADGQEGTARLWFTTDKSIGYAFKTIRNIFVHNAKTDEDKVKIRKTVDGVKNSDELLDLCQSLVGKAAWYEVEISDRVYQNSKGEEKHSYNRDIYGYEPTPTGVTKVDVESIFGETEGVEDGDIPANL